MPYRAELPMMTQPFLPIDGIDRLEASPRLTAFKAARERFQSLFDTFCRSVFGEQAALYQDELVWIEVTEYFGVPFGQPVDAELTADQLDRFTDAYDAANRFMESKIADPAQNEFENFIVDLHNHKDGLTA